LGNKRVKNECLILNLLNPALNFSANPYIWIYPSPWCVSLGIGFRVNANVDGTSVGDRVVIVNVFWAAVSLGVAQAWGRSMN
jgi:hypothetical protein